MSRTAVTKPVPEDHEWGEAVAGGDIATPSDGLKGTGYATNPTIPKRTHWNYFLRKFDRGIRYLISRGLPDWDAAETYQVGDVVRYTSGGDTYLLVAVVTPTVALNPLTLLEQTGRQWERWMASTLGDPAAATANRVITSWRSNKAFQGNAITRLGYLSGARANDRSEFWRGAESFNVTGTGAFANTNIPWTYSITNAGGDGSLSVINPSTTLAAKAMRVDIGSGAADESRVLSEPLGVWLNHFEVEFTVNLGANIDHQRLAVGLNNSINNLYGDASTFAGGIFFKSQANANWHCITGDGTTLGTDTDTLVAATANTSYLMRIEYMQASFSNDGVEQVRFYINDVRVGRLIANLPAASGTNLAALFLGSKRDGAAGGTVKRSNVMPIRFHSYF